MMEEVGFAVEVVDKKYIGLLLEKYPWKMRIVLRLGLSKLLLRQVGMAVVLTKT